RAGAVCSKSARSALPTDIREALLINRYCSALNRPPRLRSAKAPRLTQAGNGAVGLSYRGAKESFNRADAGFNQCRVCVVRMHSQEFFVLVDSPALLSLKPIDFSNKKTRQGERHRIDLFSV